jgi:hypothetical protein
MKIAMTLAWIILLMPVNAFAERLTTNIDGVFIKNVECNPVSLGLVVSNKSIAPLSKQLIVTVFDSDGDPVDNDFKFIKLGAVSGDQYFFNYLTCSDNHSYAFRFE